MDNSGGLLYKPSGGPLYKLCYMCDLLELDCGNKDMNPI